MIEDVLTGPWEQARRLVCRAVTLSAGDPLAPLRHTPGRSGQTGIRVRRCLLDGDAQGAAAELVHLDPAHHVEILLGGALRDGRHHHLAARLYLVLLATARPTSTGAHWAPLLELLADGEPDLRADEAASAWIAARRVPDVWRADGAVLSAGAGLGSAPPGPETEAAVVRAYAAGVSGLVLVDALDERPLYPAVSAYYRLGTIHALGPRPLLILAAT